MQANWPNLTSGGMYHGWLPSALSLAAGCGPLRSRGAAVRVGNSWQWTQLPDCKSSTIVPPIALVLFSALVLPHPPRKCCTTNKEGKKGCSRFGGMQVSEKAGFLVGKKNR